MSENNQNSLIISDLQAPFHNKKALAFIAYAKKHFKVADDRVFCVGDEDDQYFASLYKHDPDAAHTPTTELGEAIEFFKSLADICPTLWLAESNHGTRWHRKAYEAQIPSFAMRKHREIIQAPETWHWAERWQSRTDHRFDVIHGLGYSGHSGHRTAALDLGISVAIGHLHAHAGIAHITTAGQKLWGMNTGCLIDTQAYAFHYGKDSRFKPCLGLGIVLEKGRTPFWMPLE